MGRSYTDIIVHIIFHTKSQDCALLEADLPQIFRYIGGIVRSLSAFSYSIGGRPDHIHMLTALPSTMSLSDFVRTIKSGSSKWIKGLKPEYKDFSWQEGYGAFSVSESKKNTVINYINNQQEHHKECSTYEEFTLFLKKHGIYSPKKPSE